MPHESSCSILQSPGAVILGSLVILGGYVEMRHRVKIHFESIP